jgi:[acyl-carrier-protein] S-malonyltransferase
MAPVQPRLAAVLAALPIDDPQFPVISNVEASAVSSAARVGELLCAQVCAPVRWVACVEALKAHGASELWELGPGRALAGMVRRIDRELTVISLGTTEQLEAFIER